MSNNFNYWYGTSINKLSKLNNIYLQDKYISRLKFFIYFPVF